MSTAEWPEGLPRTYEGLADKYGKYIAKQVERYNKVDRNFEDLFQSIWVKLMESDILNKFAARARADLPPTMTVMEACSYLGVEYHPGWQNVARASKALRERMPKIPVPIEGSWFSRVAVVRTADIIRLDRSGYIRKRRYDRISDSKGFGDKMTVEEACAYLGVDFHPFWHNLMRAAKNERTERHVSNTRLPYPIEPISGTLLSRKAVLVTRDVVALDESGYLRRRPLERVRPKLSARGFKSYLSRAIHNHFANFCRTTSRRYKEHVLPPTTIIGSTSAGYCYAGKSETGTAWEGALLEAMISAEDAVDVVSEIRKAHVDPNTPRGTEVLDIMAQGYTIREALERIDQPPRSRVRKKVRVRARAMA